MSRFARRLQRLRELMDELGWAAVFLPPSGDLEYLTGVRRQRPHATRGHMHGDWLHGALVTPTACVFVSAHLAAHYVERQLADKPWFTEFVRIAEGADVRKLARRLLGRFELAGQTVALPNEAMAATVAELLQLDPSLRFRSSTPAVGTMRAIKDSEEIALMRRASELTDRIFEAIVAQLRVGLSETEIMLEVERQMLLQGSEGSSFITGVMIKGPGVDDALEGVGRAGGATLLPSRVLAFDFGVVLDGYVSDFGRTVYCGEPDAELLRIHDLVNAAQDAGIAALRAGAATTSEVDQAARSVIADAGYGPNFFHRLGHGIGIDVHEAPFLAVGDNSPLAAGMCFTVEPSIWLEQRCFTRVEDVVVVTERGGQSLNRASRAPIVIA
jgi:D-alanyl-D-alanine dipeptidase